MDYNQNSPYGQHGNPIYFQADSPETAPRQTSEPDGSFAIAALVCGICSVVLCCTGVLSVSLGALGILFTVLSRRRDKSMPPLSIAGLTLSILGLVLGGMLCIYVLGTYLSDPDYGDAFRDGYRNGYQDYYNGYYDDDYYNDDYHNDYYNDGYYNDDYYNDDYYDGYYNDDYYNHYYDDFFDYFRDFYGDDFFYDDFYNYGFENL